MNLIQDEAKTLRDRRRELVQEQVEQLGQIFVDARKANTHQIRSYMD